MKEDISKILLILIRVLIIATLLVSLYAVYRWSAPFMLEQAMIELQPQASRICEETSGCEALKPIYPRWLQEEKHYCPMYEATLKRKAAPAAEPALKEALLKLHAENPTWLYGSWFSKPCLTTKLK